MGNRAVITASREKDPKYSSDIGIYLHWDGSPESVYAFLKYCEMRGFRAPDEDCYGWARLCQVIANYIGGDLSIGIDTCSHLDCDNMDNGTYVIRGWRVTARRYYNGMTVKPVEISYGMLLSIDMSQPKEDQLGTKKIKQLLYSSKEEECDIRATA